MSRTEPYSHRPPLSPAQNFSIVMFWLIGPIVIGILIFIGVTHNNGIHTGTVISKVDYPASTSSRGLPVSERWSVTISADKKTNSFNLSHSQWETIHEGDVITINGNNVVKVKH